MKTLSETRQGRTKVRKKAKVANTDLFLIFDSGNDTAYNCLNNRIMNKRTMTVAISLLITLTAFAQQSNVNLSYNPQKDTEGLI